MDSDKKWETATERVTAFKDWMLDNPHYVGQYKLSPSYVIYRKFLEETGRL